MKIFNKLLVVVGIVAFGGACEPIEDREILTNSYDPDNIELVATQTAGGTGNGITLKMNTPGITGYWDYKLNNGLTNEVSFISPFMGNVTFSYVVSSPFIPNGSLIQKEKVIKEITVNVQVADQPVPQAFKNLVGEDLNEKTWVFEKNGTGGPMWYMSDPNNWESIWWNAGAEVPPPLDDAEGKMVFDLKGNANFTHFTHADDPTGTSGKFSFNADFSKLYISGTKKILGNTPSLGSPTGEYKIIMLEPDKMILQIPGNANCATCGHVWIFIPQE